MRRKKKPMCYLIQCNVFFVCMQRQSRTNPELTGIGTYKPPGAKTSMLSHLPGSTRERCLMLRVMALQIVDLAETQLMRSQYSAVILIHRHCDSRPILPSRFASVSRGKHWFGLDLLHLASILRELM